MQKEGGEEGRKKLEQDHSLRRRSAWAWSWAYAYWVMLKNYTNQGYADSTAQSDFISAAVIVLSFTAGSAFVMWLGEQITEFGIGNGISIILFANIISRLPSRHQHDGDQRRQRRPGLVCMLCCFWSASWR